MGSDFRISDNDGAVDGLTWEVDSGFTGFSVPHLFTHSLIHPPLMKTASLLKVALAIVSVSTLSSCVAGRVDRVEDRYDRREDRVDRRHYDGPGDRIEDRYDKRENVNDKLRGRRGLRY